MNLDEVGATSPYARYAFSFLASLVPSAPVALYQSAVASGAFMRSESVSVYGLWVGVGIWLVIAAPLFWLFMKLGGPMWSPSRIRVAVVASVSAVCLGLLGQLAAATTWLDGFVAGLLWVVAMLTLGYLPFARARTS